MVTWPYTDMTDPRWRFGSEFITLRQTKDGGNEEGQREESGFHGREKAGFATETAN